MILNGQLLNIEIALEINMNWTKIRRHELFPNETIPNVKIPNWDWHKNPERKNPELGLSPLP
jgi:hypothetical protein